MKHMQDTYPPDLNLETAKDMLWLCIFADKLQPSYFFLPFIFLLNFKDIYFVPF